MIDLASHPRHGERIVGQRADEAVVLLSLENGEYYTLEGVGARIWELCDGTRAIQDVAAVIAAEYDAPPDVVRADLLELLADLAQSKLIALGAAGESTHPLAIG